MTDTEYWLQKKTIGGWSHVTWYSDQVEAMENYNRVTTGNSGYSWRLVEANVMHEKMLEEVVKVEAPVVELVSPLFKMVAPDKPKSSGWGDVPEKPEFKAPINPWADTPRSEHGLSGSVWVINHSERQKSRVPANEIDSYLAKGYVRGGPRTQFRT